jgi:hypothetical protein
MFPDAHNRIGKAQRVHKTRGAKHVKLSSAKLLREGKREIRSIGDPCDPACHVWTFCSNSLPNGTCEGFIILNGDSRRLINQNLREDDLVYAQNCAKIAQNECDEQTRDVMVKEILRYIPQHRQPRESGFRGMLEALERPRKPEREERAFVSGFEAMCKAATKKEPIPTTQMWPDELDISPTSKTEFSKFIRRRE